MTIIRTKARLFEHLLPLITAESSRGLKYLGNNDDGTVRPSNPICVKVVYFDDGKDAITFKDITSYAYEASDAEEKKRLEALADGR